MAIEERIDTEVAVDWPAYRSTALRAPKRPLVVLPERFRDLEGPVFGDEVLEELDNDLTRQGKGEPLGERIIVTGRVLDEDGRPLRGALVEVWQGNFPGAGRCLTDDDGVYRFTTIKPGAYPWGNHPNAWRPAHIHFSLFGRLFTERLVTQMYFPDDPLHALDPIM